MPWQQAWSDVIGEVDPATGRMYYPTVIEVVPRRAGKSFLTLATHVQRMSTAPYLRNWATSITESKMRELYRLAWVPTIQSSALSPALKCRMAQGSESLTLRSNGSVCSLFAPTRSGTHGDDADMVSIDEVWAFDVVQGREAMVGIRPAQATRPRRQTLYLSAAGDEASTWLDELMVLGRRAVESGERSGVAYIEYSAADSLDDVADPYDPALLAAVHPAYGLTIDATAIADDAKSMSVYDYARSYLGIRTGARELVPIVDLNAWAAVIDAKSMADPLAFGCDVAFDRTSAAIAVAGRREDGRLHVEVVDTRAGTGWVAARLAELHTRWHVPIVVDDKGPSVTLLAELEKLHVPVNHPGTAGVTAAAAGFCDAVTDATLRHRGQPALQNALRAAARRPVGDAWAFSRKGSTGDVSALVAASLALWGATALEPAGLQMW